MELDTSQFIARLREAFPDPGFPAGHVSPCGCTECTELVEFLHEHPRWQQWTADDCFSAKETSLLDEGFEYFLPAYMAAFFVDRETMDVASDFSVWMFLSYPPRGNPSLGLFSRFTSEQQQLILTWLDRYAERESVDAKQMVGYKKQIEILRSWLKA